MHEPVVPDGDIFIHAGDLTYMGGRIEVSKSLEWIASLPHKHKIIIAGNHDWLFAVERCTARDLIPKGITYLEKELVEVEGLKIYGSPWTPIFGDWAFLYDRREADLYWKNTPECDILVTHCPPFGILDGNRYGEGVGCDGLKKVISSIKPKYHIFGHIHEQYGTKVEGATTYINASVVDSHYDNINEPVVIEI